MQISERIPILNIRNIMITQNCKRTMPWIPKIYKWFDSKSKRRQRKIGRFDYRSEEDKNNPTQENHDRCHTMGLAVARQCFIWAVKNTHWRPSKKTIYNLLNYVINYEGNIVICHRQFNIQWRDGGQKTLLKILKNYTGGKIDIPQQQVAQLLRVLNGIRKRYYKRFFKKCLKYGVSQDAVQQIHHLLQIIYKQAKKVRLRMEMSRQSPEGRVDDPIIISD